MANKNKIINTKNKMNIPVNEFYLCHKELYATQQY